MKSTTHVSLEIIREGKSSRIQVPVGSNLRQVLLEAGFSPYTQLTRRLNCGGRGLCATCGVWIVAAEPQPQHWHDRLADQYGYPRLSCQITVTEPMSIEMIPDKVIWGKRRPKKKPI
jgi:ferredoxin